jgi:AbrB family looped-hinge helix DNA binding protein
MKMQGVVTSKGQLVIPAELRRTYRIVAGTRVRFAQIHGGIGVYPENEDNIDRYCGILAGLGLPSDLERDPDREIK